MEENLGRIISGWRIIRTIGKGSFGAVYEVEKEGSFGAVTHSALKVISIPETSAEIKAYRDDGYDDMSLTALFRSQVEDITEEFSLMSKLKGNSNIVSYEDHEIIQHESDPGYDIYIRMELLTSLPDYINRQYPDSVVPDEATASLGIDICNALELCAKHHIIHRDIKPQNIFVNDNNNFKLGDFGIAKTSDHTTKATKTGTYGYMAPEVYLSKPYNASVDIYSLGVVMYWMLNERRGPFLPLPPAVPKTGQSSEALERRMHGEALPAPKHGSEELKRIVLKACAYNPKDRYTSPTEMKQDLERVLGVPPIVAAGAGSVMQAGADANAQAEPDPNLTYDDTIGADRPAARSRENIIDKDATVDAFRASKSKKQAENPVQHEEKQEHSATDQNNESGKAPDRRQTGKRKQKRIWIIAAILAVTAIVVIVLLLLNCRNCKGTKPAGGNAGALLTEATVKPTEEPTEKPTDVPTEVPTQEPTEEPIIEASPEPEVTTPTPKPATPIPTPTRTPTRTPTPTPTRTPTPTPTRTPTPTPTRTPTPTWSTWSTNVPPSGAIEVETKIQYRYRDKSTTTSESSSLSGWIFLSGPEKVYGEWSSWGDSSISSNNNLEVERRTVYRLYYKLCPKCGAHNAFDNDPCRDCSYKLPTTSSTTKWVDTPYSQLGAKQYSNSSKKMVVGSNSKNQWFFNKADLNKTNPSDSDFIKYQYRSRTITYIYTFYRWSDWSQWSDTVVSSSSTRDVETRVMYRYKK